MSSPRPSGGPPYFRRGAQIRWHYRRPRWRPGDPQMVLPATVVEDGPEALVAWVPAGTPYLVPRREDGSDLRSGELSTFFTAPRIQGRDVWRGFDTLRIAPTGLPWSVWAFFEPGPGRFDGWYVNLEDPHVRDADGVYSGDHVLDVLVGADGSHRRKDEHELVAAVEQGRYTPEEARRIEAAADRVEEVVAAWGSPFCDGWERFRPDPEWPVPQLL